MMEWKMKCVYSAWPQHHDNQQTSCSAREPKPVIIIAAAAAVAASTLRETPSIHRWGWWALSILCLFETRKNIIFPILKRRNIDCTFLCPYNINNFLDFYVKCRWRSRKIHKKPIKRSFHGKKRNHSPKWPVIMNLRAEKNRGQGFHHTTRNNKSLLIWLRSICIPFTYINRSSLIYIYIHFLFFLPSENERKKLWLLSLLPFLFFKSCVATGVQSPVLFFSRFSFFFSLKLTCYLSFSKRRPTPSKLLQGKTKVYKVQQVSAIKKKLFFFLDF